MECSGEREVVVVTVGHGACQLSWDWGSFWSLQASVRAACRREARVPLIVGSERLGDASGASIADLGPGSMLLLGDGEGRFSESPFARVRPQTSYVHKERRVSCQCYNLPTPGHRETHMYSESVRRRHSIFPLDGDHGRKEERKAETGR
jgi:hypothetical protein